MENEVKNEEENEGIGENKIVSDCSVGGFKNLFNSY